MTNHIKKQRAVKLHPKGSSPMQTLRLLRELSPKATEGERVNNQTMLN